MDELHPLVEVGQVFFSPLVKGDMVQVVAPDAADILVVGGDGFGRPGDPGPPLWECLGSCRALWLPVTTREDP